MGKFFISIYNFFEQRKAVLYLSLILCVFVMAYFASKIKMEENITRIFPNTANSENFIKVFDNLRVKDKIIVMFSFPDNSGETGYDKLIQAGETFKETIENQLSDTHIKSILFKAENEMRTEMMDMVYDNLPLFLSDEDYTRFDSLFNANKMAEIMQRNYNNMISPAGMVMRDYILRDPLGLGGEVLKGLQDFQLEATYEMQDGYIFSQDGNTLLMFITPVFDMGNTKENEVLVNILEKEIYSLRDDNPDMQIEYFGGPSVSVYNARQIKKDTMLTLTIALVIITVFIFLVFKNKKSIPLMLAPVIFGGLFGLFITYLIKGSISAIAVGAGSIVLGIALSYSIHMVAHQNHVRSIRQLISELAYPLTIGSFTTICAFLGLLFTSSELLRDFGLFASMSLIGTTLFCLIYLPHFLSPAQEEKEGRVLRFIERFNAYDFDRNKYLVWGIIILTVICVFTSQKVGFDEDMTSMGYEPAHLKEAENKLTGLFEDSQNTIYFISIGKNDEQALEVYQQTNKKLNQLREEGLVSNYASAERFIVSQKTKEEKIRQWNTYWTAEKKNQLEQLLSQEAEKLKFKTSAFHPFFAWLNSDFSYLVHSSEYESSSLLREFKSDADDFTMLISQVQFDKSDKEEVYSYFTEDSDMVIFDRSYFTNKFMSSVNNDFYLVLFISSFLVFFGLLLSFGRIELTLISFLPMFISWIIIIGIMGIFGIQFNIVSIILSTFIFGIGDDFSIFIMDGLQNKYSTNKKILNSHKTAIFFSAFTIIVGMGSMVFAKHPALQSVSWMSILGMIVVVLVSYSIQPVIFRWLITNPTSKGNPPYTLVGLLNTFLFYLLFTVGCILIQIIILFLYILPIPSVTKKKWVRALMQKNTRILLKCAYFVKIKKIDIYKSLFEKPSVIIANHQSYLDILALISLSPNLVMVTNKWVWKSPVFGWVIRYAGYIYAGEGYENNLELIERRMNEGCSVVIFPEGTRSADGSIKRFHKGAFYIAEKLQKDIIPILIYGAGNIVPKNQAMYMKKGILAIKALPVIPADNAAFGTAYKERAKNIADYYRKEYHKISAEYNHTDNPYFYQRLIQNYIYKGPVLEWYVRVKVKLEKNYRRFDKLIPSEATITDIGCGYGMMGYMLNMVSPGRKLTGIDYDKEKIEVARNAFLKNENLCFRHSDALEYDLPESDVFIMNDMLHYMNYDKQSELIKKCVSLLNANGKIIIRDGNKNERDKQKVTTLTEILSTRIFKFNKLEEELFFTSEEQLTDIALSCGMHIEKYKNDNLTSNTVFILKRKNDA